MDKQLTKLKKNGQMIGYIYLLIECEHIKTNENIFKFGKTNDSLKNINQNEFPVGSCILYFQEVYEYDKVEKNIITLLENNYVTKKDVGDGIFKGELIDILIDIISVANEYTGDNTTIINKSKKELKKYYSKFKNKCASTELINYSDDVIKNDAAKKEYQIILNNNNNIYVNLHDAFIDIVTATILEDYALCRHVIKTKQLNDKDSDIRCLILAKYNFYEYIIKCVKHDHRNGIFDDDSNNKYVKIAGAFIDKIADKKSYMDDFLHDNIPVIFHDKIKKILS
jgi:hypothetical protein